MTEKFKITEDQYMLPTVDAREELVTFGVIDEADQDACYEVLAASLKEVAQREQQFKIGTSVMNSTEKPTR